MSINNANFQKAKELEKQIEELDKFLQYSKNIYNPFKIIMRKYKKLDLGIAVSGYGMYKEKELTSLTEQQRNDVEQLVTKWKEDLMSEFNELMKCIGGGQE